MHRWYHQWNAHNSAYQNYWGSTGFNGNWQHCHHIWFAGAKEASLACASWFSCTNRLRFCIQSCCNSGNVQCFLPCLLKLITETGSTLNISGPFESLHSCVISSSRQLSAFSGFPRQQSTLTKRSHEVGITLHLVHHVSFYFIRLFSVRILSINAIEGFFCLSKSRTFVNSTSFSNLCYYQLGSTEFSKQERKKKT